ncbi:NAD(P)-dependent oxidoreductase [Salinibacterium sp. ZJ70]|uniref:NAD-dependent epimerase/dehydratase family protein n=1 Tax=Salinibacterium sp. ZJ70 TaxID=2708084 RepID=UPI00141F2995|nr:NAD(P)-dependent oxidoreductase [Salinibacterium sp. ZJ70]
MKTALVTGAAGLLGKATVDALADAGVEVHALVRDASQGFRDDVQFHSGDLSQPIDSSALPAQVDAIFHLAQAREFRDFPGGAPATFAINVASTVGLLDYAGKAGASSFVYASSGGVYEGAAGEPLTEDAPVQRPEKLGFYLGTKLSSEALVNSYASEFSTACLRYFFIYGPDQARGMLVPRLYDRVRNGEAITLQGEHGMRINPVHAADAAAATIAAAAVEGRTTSNIAGPQVVSLREVGEIFASDLGRAAVFEGSEGPATDLIASIDRMSELLARPTITLRDALADIRG